MAIQSDESNYAKALDELVNGTQDRGVWAKAFADSSGDQERAKSLYVKRRAKALSQRAGDDSLSQPLASKAKRAWALACSSVLLLWQLVQVPAAQTLGERLSVLALLVGAATGFAFILLGRSRRWWRGGFWSISVGTILGMAAVIGISVFTANNSVADLVNGLGRVAGMALFLCPGLYLGFYGLRRVD